MVFPALRISVKFDTVKWIMTRDFILPSGTSFSSCLCYLRDNNYVHWQYNSKIYFNDNMLANTLETNDH